MASPISSSSKHPPHSKDSAQSSASLCIQLCFLDNKSDDAMHRVWDNPEDQFQKRRPSSSTSSYHHPEFTHQLFDGEWIRGFEPFPPLSSNEQEPIHRFTHDSHKNHSSATNYLRLLIQVSPTCEVSRVQVQIEPKKQKQLRNPTKKDHEEEPPKVKRARFADDVISPPASPSPPNVLTKEDLISIIQRALPPIIGTDPAISLPTISQPIGKELTRYRLDENGSTFLLTVTDGQDQSTSTYHSKVQPLALWFIENADNVDVSSTDRGGFWKILYLWKVNDSVSEERGNIALVGYMTLFFFHAPFKKPKPGLIVRICQALLLPPFQRKGHGTRLMKALYEHSTITATSSSEDRGAMIAGDNKDHIVEINVEDPAPGFTMLRNRVDFERCLEENWFTDLSLEEWKPPSQKQTMSIACRALITSRQVQIAYELWRLNAMKQKYLDGRDGDKHLSPLHEDETIKPYRLMVKKRLLKVYTEDLGALETKEERKNFLRKVFDELWISYCRILRIPPTGKAGISVS